MHHTKLLLFQPLLFICLLGCAHPDNKTEQHPRKWYIELNSNDVGLVRGFMDFEFKDSSFTAYTRKNADRDLLGFWKSLLGRLFTSSFKHGSLLNIGNGTTRLRGDTLLLSGIFQSAIGNYYFNGRMVRGALTATLTSRNKTVKGTITGSQQLPALPLSNYPELIELALKKRNEKIYNTTILNSKACKEFDHTIRHMAGIVQDDLELEFAFFYYAGKLPFSHFSLLRVAPEQNEEKEKTLENQVVLEEKSATTAYMKISSFMGTAAEMDSVFSIILQKNYRNLVVDLRNNPGGSVEAGMQFARWVVDSTLYGGVFLTQKWFTTHKDIPRLNEYSSLPHFSESNFDLIIQGIHEQEGLCLKVIPRVPNYHGKLFILTNNGTGSTCEPIVYSLKQYRRGIIVGEKTAGAMLTGELFQLTDGFKVVIPTADYYAPDGYRIDRKGVTPSIEIKSEKALDHVMEQLMQEQR